MKRRLASGIAIAIVTTMLLAGCHQQNVNTENTELPNETTSLISRDDKKYSSITELKQKYGVDDSKEVKPLYNVPKDIKFTFKFKSMVDPYKAVTVHTDKACGVNSMVNIIPAGFSTPDGEDVMIIPNSPVLNSQDRLDYSTENTYGYAPIYYLCIRYDLDSTEVKELENPIIIPFTIKGDVQTPTAYPEISTDGIFTLKWNPIESVDSYRIYEAYVSSSDRERGAVALRRENAYVGEHLNLIGEVPASETSFSDFVSASDNNTFVDSDGNVFTQNAYTLNNYYVTAVKDGKESFFSQEVSGWKYNSQLPKSFDSYFGFKRENGKVTEFPETVQVEMADGSKTDMPINFKKIDGTYEALQEGHDVATYEYEILGTRLSGKIEYHSKDGQYPDTIASSVTPNYGLYDIQVAIDAVPGPEVPTISDDSYKNKYVDLSKSAKYHKESLVAYDEGALMERADIEAERILMSGQYQRDPFALDYVKSFGEPMDPVYPDTDGYKEPEKQTTSAVEIEPETTSMSEEPQETTAVPTEETTKETETSAETADGEITSANVIEEQINSTNNQVEEGNTQEYKVSGYPSFAESAEEEFIAENLINRNETFSVQAFPKLQDMETLKDVLLKVYYQNPYVFGFENAGYNPYTMEVQVLYNMPKDEIQKRQEAIDEESNKLIKEIINGSMSDDEKVYAIYEYLENNTVYDHDAVEAAEANGFTDVSGFEDSFNTYGILCNKKGVCQSYAYTVNLLCKKADVSSKMLTGYMSKTMPHAWNAVEYNDSWYWIDATNNGKSSGIPFLLYQTSSDTAEKMDYILDAGFNLDTKLNEVTNYDTSKDWYTQNNLIADSPDELIDKVVEIFDGSEAVAVRYTFDLTLDDNFVQKLGAELMKKGVDVTNTRFGSSMMYFIITN